MRLSLMTCLVLICSNAVAETPPAPRTVVACDNLVTLRRLMAQDPKDDAIPVEFTGCSTVQPDRIGDVEKRAMIGDAPYECRTLKDSPCLWVRP